MDLFDSLGDDVKIEIFSFVADAVTFCRFCRVSKSWNHVLQSNKIWFALVRRDYGENDEIKADQEHGFWKIKYKEYVENEWRWDPTKLDMKIVLSNNNRTAHLWQQGTRYSGARVSRGESHGKHFFEVVLDRDTDNSHQINGIGVGIGLADQTFDVSNCSRGWTQANKGVGYYNDGQIFCLGKSLAYSDLRGPARTVRGFRQGDKIGIKFHLDKHWVQFYVDGQPIVNKLTYQIPQNTTVYPHLILNTAARVTIITKRTTAQIPKLVESPRTLESQAREMHLKEMKYATALSQLIEMGFENKQLNLNLLEKHSGVLEAVLNELVGILPT